LLKSVQAALDVFQFPHPCAGRDAGPGAVPGLYGYCRVGTIDRAREHLVGQILEALLQAGKVGGAWVRSPTSAPFTVPSGAAFAV
jgi:hypothetical protein